ncbi:MAG: tetratricopeptide repeat protein [Proteobacteria bacterium]|nr:tetratricopeptide repeat protein [Pseudomonadota bacterium]
MNPQLLQSMQRASALLQAGNFVAARATLEQVLAHEPRFVEARRLLAGALLGIGDRAEAERELRQAVAIDPAWSPAQCALGELLLGSGRADEGEHALRRALAGSRPYPRSANLLALHLNASRRFAETLAITHPHIAKPHADAELLRQHAIALNALGRSDEAADIWCRIAALLPDDADVAFHLAAALDAGGRHRDAEKTMRRAIALGAVSPEAKYLHARTLIATDRHDEAEALLRDVVRERPEFADAHRNLAQLVWMRRGDAAAATAALDETLRRHPHAQPLYVVRASVLEATGDAQAAHRSLAACVELEDASVETLVAASHAALRIDPALALRLVERAARINPDDTATRHARIEALFATGDAEGALRQAETMLHAYPDDQRLLAAQAAAWRLLGDARHAQYCDYPTMVGAYPIKAPPGWRDVQSYLHDLAASLDRLHTLRTHPLHQSLRHGSQTAQNLLDVDDAAVRAFLHAIDDPIRCHIAAIGRGSDPLRRRNRGDYRVAGIWSARLNGGGFHTNHVHPKGWLSSACYIRLPRTMAAASMSATADAPADRSGWLQFGEPGYPTVPVLDAQHFIRPEPGLLALFPSYFWHGTVPFQGDDTRLTIAFDLVPA